MQDIMWRSRSGVVKNLDEQPKEYVQNIVLMLERGSYKDGATIEEDQMGMFDDILKYADLRGIINGEKFGWDE